MSLVDLTNVVEQGGLPPDGAYNVNTVKAELVDTKSGGKMIKTQLKIIDGNHAGRIIFDSFNIENLNPLAVQIGRGQLKSFLKASHFMNPNSLESTEQLIGLKCIVKTKIEDQGPYGEQIRIKSYSQLAKTAPVNADPFA